MQTNQHMDEQWGTPHITHKSDFENKVFIIVFIKEQTYWSLLEFEQHSVQLGKHFGRLVLSFIQ